MKIEKFTASTMMEVMDKIQKKLGADAIIYSKNKTDRGIEIIAGIPQQNIHHSLDKTATSQSDDFIKHIKQMEHHQLSSELQQLEKHHLIIRKLRKLHFPYHFCERFAEQYSAHCTLETIHNNEMIIKILLSQLHIEETELIHIKKYVL